MRGSKKQCVAPPPLLAARIAASAWAIRSCIAPCSGYMAMPIELETAASWPFILHGSPIWPCIRSAKVTASSSLGLPRISIRNSSPPRCATRSSGRAKRFSRVAISRSIRSPM